MRKRCFGRLAPPTAGACPISVSACDDRDVTGCVVGVRHRPVPGDQTPYGHRVIGELGLIPGRENGCLAMAGWCGPGLPECEISP